MKNRILCLLLAGLLSLLCACGGDRTLSDTDGTTDLTNGTTSEESTPEESTPEEPTPEESTPEESTPEESTPEESTPEESTPEESTPEESTPEESTPEELTTEEPTYDEPPVPPAAEDAAGMRFEQDCVCTVERSYSNAPHTVSAWICVEENFDGRGGAIISNSNQSRKNYISLEIHKNGNPYFCYLDRTYVENKILFDEVDVRTGEWLYLTVVLNEEAGYARCYVNGVLAQQSASDIKLQKYNSSVTVMPFAIGGDLQESNERFFVGGIKELALFSDVRTTTEIRNDYTNGVSADATELIALYDMREVDELVGIRDLGEGGYNVTCKRDFYGDSQAYKGEYAYSVAVVGDTQMLTFYGVRGGAYKNSLPNLYEWILANKDEKNIQYVIGLGDITETGVDDDHRNYNPEEAAKQWTFAKDAITKMDGILPYTLIRGSGHDGVNYFNEYFASHEGYTGNIAGYYQDGRIENVYHTFTYGDVKYLILCLDFGAKDPVLEWASDVIEAHADHRVIVTTHAYLEKDGSLLETGEAYCPSQSYYDPTNNDGNHLWEKLISKHENIDMVISGHMSSDTVVVSYQTGDHGNEVMQILIDPQSIDGTFSNGGTGMVAMFYFSEAGDILAIEYYSTVRDSYKPLLVFETP